MEKFEQLYLAFYEKPRSISEVSRLTGISRATIYKNLNFLEPYLEDKTPTFPLGKGKEKLLQSKPDIFLKEFEKNFNFSKKEISHLDRILQAEHIRKCYFKWKLVEKQKNLYDCFMWVLFVISIIKRGFKKSKITKEKIEKEKFVNYDVLIKKVIQRFTKYFYLYKKAPKIENKDFDNVIPNKEIFMESLLEISLLPLNLAIKILKLDIRTALI